MPLIGKGFTMLKEFQIAAKIPAIFNMPLNFLWPQPVPPQTARCISCTKLFF